MSALQFFTYTEMENDMSWKQLHEEMTVVDLHTHPSLKSNLFHRDLTVKHARKLFGRATWPMETRTDFIKMKEGGLDVALSTIYIPEQEWLDDLLLLGLLVKYLKPSVYREVFRPTYFDATINAIREMEEQIARYNLQVREGGRKIRVCMTPNQLKMNLDAGALCFVHSVEGGHSLQGEVSGKRLNDNLMAGDDEIEEELLANLEVLRDKGVAYLTLAHFYPNHCVSPVFPYPEHALKWARKDMKGRWDETLGLTAIGERVVERIFELGMLLDITHCTPAARARVYELADHHKRQAGVIATHLGVARMNTDPINLQDWEVRWIADNGGVVGTIFMNYWLTGESRHLGVRYIVDTIRELEDIGGQDVVAFGSDFDGFTDPPDDMRDMTDLPRLTRQLAAEYTSKGLRDRPQRRWPDEVIRKFMGGNALRVLFEGWKCDE